MKSIILLQHYLFQLIVLDKQKLFLILLKNQQLN